jgi:hypothetical protein
MRLEVKITLNICCDIKKNIGVVEDIIENNVGDQLLADVIAGFFENFANSAQLRVLFFVHLA